MDTEGVISCLPHGIVCESTQCLLPEEKGLKPPPFFTKNPRQTFSDPQ